MKNLLKLFSTLSVLALATTVFATPAHASSSAVKQNIIDPVTLLNAETITVTVVPAAAIKKITLSFAGASWNPAAPMSAPAAITLSTSFTPCSKYPALEIKISGTADAGDTCHLQKPGPSNAELERVAAGTSWGTVTFQIAAGALKFDGESSVLTVESWDGSASGTLGTLSFTTVGSTDSGTDSGTDSPASESTGVETVNQDQQAKTELAKTGSNEAFIAPLSLAAMLMIAGASAMLLRRRRA